MSRSPSDAGVPCATTAKLADGGLRAVVDALRRRGIVVGEAADDARVTEGSNGYAIVVRGDPTHSVDPVVGWLTARGRAHLLARVFNARSRRTTFVFADESTLETGELVCTPQRQDDRPRLSRWVQGWAHARPARGTRGLFVVLLGPDGAGKSTVAEALRERLRSVFPQVFHFHWRPGWLRRIRATRAPASEPVAPSMTYKYGTVVSLLRFGYYLIDFAIGGFLRITLATRRGALVIGERYYPDILVHPQRYAFKLPRALVRAASCLVPEPDITIVLRATPEQLWQRKGELPVDVLRSQMSAYTDITRLTPGGRIVETDEDLERTVRRVAALVLAQCAPEREQGDGGASQRSAPASYIAWPRPERARLFLESVDRGSRTAWSVWYSVKQSTVVAQSVARLIPPSIQRLTLGDDRPTSTDEVLIRQYRALVRRILPIGPLSVNFFHRETDDGRRFTAQVSKNETILCYVKFGDDPNRAATLEREAKTLKALVDCRSTTVVVPRVLEEVEEEGVHALVLSPPTDRREPCSLTPDERTMSLLEWLAAVQAEQSSPMELIQRFPAMHGIDRLESIRERARAWLARSGCQSSPCTWFGHGDLMPPNMFRLGADRVFVFDWEHSDRYAPLYDAFHYIVLPALLVKRDDPGRLAARLMHSLERQQGFIARLGERQGLTSDRQLALLLDFGWRQMFKDLTNGPSAPRASSFLHHRRERLFLPFLETLAGHVEKLS